MYTKFRTKMHHLAYDILDIIPINKKFWKKLLTKEMTFYSFKETERVVDCFNLAGYMPYQRNDFEPAIKAKFEDLDVRIPKNYDKLLTQIYGDYMKIPPEEDRYNAAPEITRTRIYLETMQEVLSKSNKIVLDVQKGSSPVLYLPMPQQRQRRCFYRHK